MTLSSDTTYRRHLFAVAAMMISGIAALLVAWALQHAPADNPKIDKYALLNPERVPYSSSNGTTGFGETANLPPGSYNYDGCSLAALQLIGQKGLISKAEELSKGHPECGSAEVIVDYILDRAAQPITSGATTELASATVPPRQRAMRR
jgi:hypothetical protein